MNKDNLHKLLEPKFGTKSMDACTSAQKKKKADWANQNYNLLKL